MSRFLWMSRKGNACASNRDRGGFVQGLGFDFGVVVDASQQGVSGEALAADLVRVVLATAIEGGAPDAAHVVAALRAFHAQSRFQYVCETASYALVLRRHDGSAWALVCGDCRVGRLCEAGFDGDVTWLSPVHTLANAFGESFELQHAKSAQRHTLTRCWNARRFERPEFVLLDGAASALCLATDGFWLEHRSLGGSCGELDDDASCLVMTDSQAADSEANGCEPLVASDCSNFLVLR